MIENLHVYIQEAMDRGENIWLRPLGTSTVADHLGVCEDWVRQRIECGAIPARRLGRNYQIPRIVIEYFKRVS